MARDRFKKLLFHKTSLKLLSIVLAFCVWVIAAISLQTSGNRVLDGVPVIIDVQSDRIVNQGLNLIDSSPTVVKVEVDGQRSVVGGLSAKDFTVEADLSQVNGPNEYDLPLVAKSKSADLEPLTVTITPETVHVRFDKMAERTFKVETELVDENGNPGQITLPDGYMLSGDPQVLPGEVTITGPEEDLNRIDHCVVRIDRAGKALNKSEKLTLPILLLDQEGNEYESEELKLDHESAEVLIKVLKTKEVPLVVQYTNVPDNFPLSELEDRCVLSNETVRVAGPTDQVDKMTELVAGYVDLRTVSAGSVFNYEVNLPEGFENLDNITGVTVEYDTDDMATKSFIVSTFNLVNVPTGYTATMVTRQLSDVQIIGPEDAISKLTGKDIVVEVNLGDRQVSEGQMTISASVLVPGKGLVWALGDNYSVVVNLKQK